MSQDLSVCLSFYPLKIHKNFSHIPSKACFVTRRFESLVHLHSDSESSPKDNCPYINQIKEIAGAPNLESALSNLDQLTANLANNYNGQMKTILDQGIIRNLIKLLEVLEITSETSIIIVRILGNIASGSQNICKCLVDEGGIQFFISIFNRSVELEDKILLETVKIT